MAWLGGWQPKLRSDTAECIAGRSWDFTKAKLYTDFSGVQKNGWRLWPLASWVTYQYIPLRLRVLFVNIVAFFWYALSLPHGCIGCTTADFERRWQDPMIVTSVLKLQQGTFHL